ncbi:MAG: hypothetical protein ACO1OB_09820 [Archangium sp.]
MFRHSWCLLLVTGCNFGPAPEPTAPVQTYCGVAQWDRSLLLAEVGSFADRPRLGETCLRVTPGNGTIELVDEAPDLAATARTFCRMSGTLSNGTATITGGECRYVNSLRSGRLSDVRGTFTFLEAQALSISLDATVEEVGSVRKYVNGAFLERDGFPQAITGTATLRYELEFSLQDAPALGDAGIPSPECPASLDGCWRTMLTPTIVVNDGEAECQALAAPVTVDVKTTSSSIETTTKWDAVKRIDRCSLVADEGTAVTPATFNSYEVDFGDGGTPSIRAWMIRDVNRGGFPIHCELMFTGQASSDGCE